MIFPCLHDMASMEKSRFLGSEAQRPCSKSAYLQRANSSPVSPTPVPSSVWNCMDQELHWAPSKKSITSSNLPTHFRPQPELLLGSVEKSPKRNQARACSSVSLLSGFRAAHTPLAPCSLTGLPHSEQLPSHFNSS